MAVSPDALRLFTQKLGEGLRAAAAQMQAVLASGELPPGSRAQLQEMEQMLAESGYAVQARPYRQSSRGMTGDPCGGETLSGPRILGH